MVERHKPQTWHAMHWRAACELYGLKPCEPKRWWLYNSGLLVLSQRHRPLVAGWEAHTLVCRVLCDQLYLNAAAQRARLCIRELGAAFNYVGSELRRRQPPILALPRLHSQPHHLTRALPRCPLSPAPAPPPLSAYAGR